MSDFLENAEKAAQQQDWARLSHYLEQQLNFGGEAPALPLQDEQARSLALALQILEFGDFQMRWDIAKLIPRLGNAAIAPLITLVQDDECDVETRWFAGRILGEFDDPIAIRCLIDLLQTTEDDDLGLMAAKALANLGTSAILALTDLLGDEETRPLAVQALAQIRRSDTIEPLLSVVADPQTEVRVWAIEALSSFHDARIPPVLVQALTDVATPVRRAAVAGLGVRSDLANELDLVALLRDRLRDLNLEVCQQAALALGRLGTPGAAEALVQELQPNAPLALQLDMIRALGWIGTSIALEALQQVLITTEQPAIQQEVVTVLGRWTEADLKPEVARVLIHYLESESATAIGSAIKQSIALALGQLGQAQALEPLIGLLSETDSGIRLHAIAALKTLNPALAHQRLEALSRQADLPSSLQQGVAIALQEW